MTIEIRSYQDLKDVAADLHQLRRDFFNCLTLYQPLNIRLQTLEAASFIDISGGRGRKPLAPTEPLSKKGMSELAKSTKLTESLHQQHGALNNILFNLGQHFSAEESPHVERMRKAATALHTKVKQQIEEEQGRSNERAQAHISKDITKTANKIKRELGERWHTDGEVKYSDALVEGKHIKVAYVIFEDVKNSLNEISPQVVIALSDVDGAPHINPGLTKMLPPGQFRPGLPYTSDANALRLVEEHMKLAGNLAAINPQDVPITQEQAGLEHKSITAQKWDKNTVSLTIAKSIKTREGAENVAQDIIRRLHTAIISSDPKWRDKMVYKIGKINGSWRITVRFQHGDKTTGRTLEQEETKHLEQRFTPQEISVMKKALRDM